MAGSVSGGETTTDLNEIVTAERIVKGGRTYGYPPLSFRGEFVTIIRSLAAGDVDIDAFVSATLMYDPDDVVEEGFEALTDADGEHVKVLVSP